MTHSLDPLFKLYDEEFRQKPNLRDPSPHNEMSKQDLSTHPEFQRKSKINTAVKTAGMSPTAAHELLNGKVDLGNVDSKASLASDLGRFENDSEKNEVRPEKDSNSIFAQDIHKQNVKPPTETDLKTPEDEEVKEEVEVGDWALDDFEDICYDGFDIIYNDYCKI